MSRHMNKYRDRLGSRSLLTAFEQARSTGNTEQMRRLLHQAEFTELEIQSVLWSKGDLGPIPIEPSVSDRVVGWIGQSLVCAILVGGVLAYISGGFSGSFSDRRHMQLDARRRVTSDFRTPYEAYYRPFLIGCVIGALLPVGYRFLANPKKNETT